MNQVLAVAFYTLSILVASMTMFLLEPIIGKSFLPVLGGTPNVWNACVLFFQFTLLAGYLYAHALSTRVPPKLQVLIHTAVVWLPIFTLPLRKPATVPTEGQDPTLWLLTSLLSSVGAVFFVTTTTTPLMQKWYSRTDSWLASDPYFLYAASNCGSMIGLIAYPFFFEPAFGLNQQLELLSVLYIIYACIITQCGRIVFSSRSVLLNVSDDRLGEYRSTIKNAKPGNHSAKTSTVEEGNAIAGRQSENDSGSAGGVIQSDKIHEVQESQSAESQQDGTISDANEIENAADASADDVADSLVSTAQKPGQEGKKSRKAKRRLKEQAARMSMTGMAQMPAALESDAEEESEDKERSESLLQQNSNTPIEQFKQESTAGESESQQMAAEDSQSDASQSAPSDDDPQGDGSPSIPEEELPVGGSAQTISTKPQDDGISVPPSEVTQSEITPPTTLQYGRWLLLSLLPSSLMLGVTTFVTQELTSFPLLWVIPLAIYLSTFMIAFSRIPNGILRWFRAITPIVAIAPLSLPVVQPGIVLVHYICLFVLCMGCHGTLALERPHPKYLTNFYLALSFGGLLGSCLNTLVAPVVFKELLEYPLMLSFTAVTLFSYPRFLKRKPYSATTSKWISPVIVIVVLSVAFLGSKGCQKIVLPESSVITADLMYLGTMFIIPLIVTFILARNAVQARWGLSAICFYVLLSFCNPFTWVVYKCRNFFGTKMIKVDTEITLLNGVTRHGSEYVDPVLRGLPTAYYTRDGIIGETLMEIYGDKKAKNLEPLGVVGMGAGELAYYMKPEQMIVFYEIDQDVISLAANPFYFSYLMRAHNRKVKIDVVQGDGRLGMQQEEDKFFRMIVLDAYNSDSIPTHLITKEAMAMYAKKLKDDGVIAVHVSNRFFDLRPIIATVADEVHLNCLWKFKVAHNNIAAVWVILTKSKDVNDMLKKKYKFNQIGRCMRRPWTDDYSSPLTVMQMRWY